MKKYYIGLSCLMIVAIGLVVVALGQSKNHKQDTETGKKIDSISASLEKYISDKNKIPESLEEANIKDVPSTITYKKIDEKSFKFCATFAKASNSYGADWTSLLFGYDPQTMDDSSYNSSGEDNSYIDTYIVYSHKKGENCQTVKPYLSDPNCLGISSRYNYECLNNDNSSSGFEGDNFTDEANPAVNL